MRSVLGIYFGAKTINIVETKNKKIVNNIEIPHEVISESGIEENIPEEVKLVNLLKNELEKSNLETKDVAITLPGKELIIRSFEMDSLVREELSTAVAFEAKKYIPFKTEDLISDFQSKRDKKRKKNLILFFSTKKEILDRYISVVDQLGLKIINNIEYAAFSLLRLLDLAGIKKKGIFSVIGIDLQEETNFTVLEDGFPLFSRDINLTVGLEPQLEIKQGIQDSSFLERLKSEIRISLDYYRRKFPSKQIKTLITIASPEYKNDIEALGKELGLSFEFIDITKYATKESAWNMGSIKAYSVSLSSAIKIPVIRPNLLFARKKVSKATISAIELEEAFVAPPIRLNKRFVLASIAVLFISFVFGWHKQFPVQKEIKEILSKRTSLTSLTTDKSYEELQGIYSDYNDKVTTLDNIVKKQIYLTPELNVIPSAMPNGTWLNSFSFSDENNSVVLILIGQAFLADRNKEFEAVNEIYSKLKSDPVFSGRFKEISITSLDRENFRDREVTKFTILCRAYHGY